ncbi:MAG TPA: Gfo/Idh/MocA family oxidoreductase [Candidatus Paceibacterota bacterium]|nr:Gfo/Idh/MocA family oxidoreductase [Verrucomicrobiota bacterium]HRY50846.1 Gfo/Idh/MocA family oxidoreductase [Candidatus Paceibacterota bacterium]HSA01183.1 Gfo/Idh/MocA family oxidoreductase [Candidatus Paceibacterota bacterium]
MNKPNINRRHFLKSAAFASLGAPLLLPSSVWSAAPNAKPNSRITLGFIGLGTQNRYHLRGFLPNQDVQVLAVAEVDKDRRESARQMADEYYTQAKAGTYKGCAAFNDFRDLISRPDIDAVVIATPDHWHAIQVIQAANAGKDIYIEKPLSLTITEARAMVNAVRANDRVCQVGSMQRSSSEFRKACEWVRNGRIGKIKEVWVNVGGPSKPCDLPTQPMQPGLDWDMWLGPAPYRGYHEILSPRGVHKHFPDWRSYIEYSGGGMTDWGAHHFDIAQWGLGMDNSGPVEIHPPDGKEYQRLTYKYANGIVMHHGGLKDYPFGVVFVGENGKVCVDRGKLKAEPESIEKTPLGPNDIHLYSSNSHHQDWIQCIRSRKQPICDVEIGCRSVTVCHLGNLAFWHKRALKWDPANEKFVGDNEANTWLDRANRAPWKI